MPGISFPHWDTVELAVVMRDARTLTEEQVSEKAAIHHLEDLTPEEWLESNRGETHGLAS
ncbi:MULTISPECIES: hypothetical protein [Streptomyces]|uniref:hypothetical protein n=1 Tax=Streptomyces TaxID=1883 RepID=UPI0034305EC1